MWWTRKLIILKTAQVPRSNGTIIFSIMKKGLRRHFDTSVLKAQVKIILLLNLKSESSCFSFIFLVLLIFFLRWQKMLQNVCCAKGCLWFPGITALDKRMDGGDCKNKHKKETQELSASHLKHCKETKQKKRRRKKTKQNKTKHISPSTTIGNATLSAQYR